MTLVPLAPTAGVCLSASEYAVGKDNAYVAGGAGSFRQGASRYVVASNIEFIAGYPQKVAGWVQATATILIGIARAICVWRDNGGLARVAIGTESHLYYLQNATLTDITPLRSISTGTLTGPITTINGSVLVAIADASQTLVNGDFVFLSAASAVGGVTLNGWYPISSRSGSGYNITVPTAASSSAGPAGGSTAFKYPRVTISGPFTTTNGSPTVTVAHTAHGAVAGNYVTFSGGSAVGGLTISGEYQIVTAATNTYTITASSNATSGASGGGSVSVIYAIQVAQGIPGNGAYGAGNYGAGGYSALPQAVSLQDGWTLSAYGNQMLGAPAGGTIYVYDPVFGGRAYPLLNAPASVNAMFVTPERYVVALGVNGIPMRLAWADQNDYTQWTSAAANTANSGRTLVGGSYLVGGVAIRDGVSLVFSNRCAFQMNFSGGDFVYTTEQIGDNCGLVAPNAVCAEGGVAYWFSDQDFWMWNGGVQPLPSDDVRASIFQGSLNRTYLAKCVVSLNRAKHQVRFWFPSLASSENDGGVIYQIDQQCFSTLAYGRTASTDANLLQVPVSTDLNGMIYFDETGVDANGAALPCNLRLGYTDISNGDKNMDVFGFEPDFQRLSGTASLTVLTKYHTPDAAAVDGPYLFTSSTGRQDLRSDGKMAAFNLAMTGIGATFRLGVPRVDAQPSGARR